MTPTAISTQAPTSTTTPTPTGEIIPEFTPTSSPTPELPPPEASSPNEASGGSGSGETSSTRNDQECQSAKPGDKAPFIYAIEGLGPTSTRIYFTEADGVYDRYAIMYGLESNNYQYGADDIGGPGSRIYDILSLVENQKYFLKMAAKNGCATGPWSNEISFVAGWTRPTPKTGLLPQTGVFSKSAKKVIGRIGLVGKILDLLETIFSLPLR